MPVTPKSTPTWPRKNCPSLATGGAAQPWPPQRTCPQPSPSAQRPAPRLARGERLPPAFWTNFLHLREKYGFTPPTGPPPPRATAAEGVKTGGQRHLRLRSRVKARVSRKPTGDVASNTPNKIWAGIPLGGDYRHSHFALAISKYIGKSQLIPFPPNPPAGTGRHSYRLGGAKFQGAAKRGG